MIIEDSAVDPAVADRSARVARGWASGGLRGRLRVAEESAARYLALLNVIDVGLNLVPLVDPGIVVARLSAPVRAAVAPAPAPSAGRRLTAWASAEFTALGRIL